MSAFEFIIKKGITCWNLQFSPVLLLEMMGCNDPTLQKCL